MIDQIVKFAPVITSLLETNDPKVSFGVCDRKHYLFTTDALGMGIAVGDAVKEGSVTHRAMTSRKPQKVTVDADQSLYNVDYTCVCVPILSENGDVCGAVSWAYNTQDGQLNKMAQELSALSEEVSASAEDFTNHAVGLSETNQRLYDLVQTLVEQMKGIQTINNLLAKLASQTKIIGLNASIEAARVGEQGRGFAVVANETRRLAEQSERSAIEISESLEQIQTRITEVFGFSREISTTSEQQAASAEELSAAMQHIARLADTLLEISEG